MKDIVSKINEASVNTGRIKEYNVNVKLEHKTYAAIYQVIRQMAGKDEKINLRNIGIWMKDKQYNWEKIADELWKNKDKDIVD